jgi:flagellin
MSVLRINQNPIALNANRHLKNTGQAIAKSLERLSSGQRINRAADDAAGMSISEKLRAQTRGLNRASSNALDGISLIQTAEGALNEIHTILQRMRELAVQSANGIYTANDRASIQLEITQLSDEIDRIASSTEFNTKKLLNGTLGALVSTDDFSKVTASVMGNVGAGGNFVMKAAAKSSGQLQVHKTDVFATQMNADAVGKLNYLQTYRANASITTVNALGVGNTGINQAAVPTTPGGLLALKSDVNGRISVYNANYAANTTNFVSTFQSQGITVSDKLVVSFIISNGGGVFQSFVVSLQVPPLATNMDGLAVAISTALTAVTNGYNGAAGNTGFNALTYNPATGQYTFTMSGAAVMTSLAVKFVDEDGGGSDFYLSFASDGSASNAFIDSVSLAFLNRGQVYDPAVAYAATGRGITIGSIGAAFSTGTLDVMFDINYQKWNQVATGAADYADVIAWDLYAGNNAIQKYGSVWQEGPAPVNGTFLVSALSNSTYVIYRFDNERYTSLVASGLDQTSAINLSKGLQLANATGANVFSVGMVFTGATGGPLENVYFAISTAILQSGETATFNLSTNNVLTADQSTTLGSLNRFQEFGVFNGRNNVEMTVYLRGRDASATINFSKNDTLEELTQKLSLAIWDPVRGTGIVNSGVLNPLEAPDLVHINTIGVAKGTISITTPIPGAELVIAADENLLNALSLMETRQGTSPVYSINAFNLETNKSVGSVKIDTNEIVGLLPGLRVFFDNTLGLRVDPEPPTDLNGGVNTIISLGLMPYESPVISMSGEVETFFIHVAPRDFSLQIGANQGQVINSFIADHSAKALGIEGLLIVSPELAQEAISIVDQAINQVSTQRSRLGAIQNRLESTIRNLDIASENLTSAESRIRDTDIAEETLNSTRNQILLQAGVAALAQANQLPQAVLQLLQ